jgi:hypothetical protein
MCPSELKAVASPITRKDKSENFVCAQAPFYGDLQWSEGTSTHSLKLDTR